ncbi:amino acid ABC transporter substrate-binding protein [Bordetella pertussis]|uniref:amino acid ABC transporter substrate-binding protein n=1 Tax=Bordetella pertussis TaxID=520 RepID=UPI0005E15F90|nr:amino acid ABC transporter substrate-binding protein [Bordetella pertussis]CFM90570.1 extracellular substrate-binding protein [Bordetella pertussis]CFW50478.1 extracellular substrate-binding protein [Bordetella pertussis]CFW83578.1 extracellular substrate-binding protein [Bordetella pertussis]CPJ06895.1 extracellular substrate-binding protein [Bordetella pertussis]CPK90948.1 extracellular substrate-binding protein [Bordetella pertussis]
MKRLLNALTAALAIGAAAAGQAHAADLDGTLKKISDTGVITIGHRETSIPFSYYDANQKPVGYSIDICTRIVDAVKTRIKRDDIQVKSLPVTSATRIPLMGNGTIDLECASTSNTLDCQKQVAFSVTTFVTGNRFISLKSANLKTIDDLKGKTVASTSGTANIRQANEINEARSLGMKVVPVKEHAEGFLMVETGRAAAFIMDDILLYGLAANAKEPDRYQVSGDSLSIEPYAIMLRRDDPQFKALVDDTIKSLYASGDFEALYKRWYQSPLPPKGINLNVAMSEVLKRVVATPTDSGDPVAYK